jgi:tetratricopeptide (TPR) repeat protein
VYTEAGETRRRILHQRALEVLQKEAAPAAELAHQAFEAELTEPAFRYSIAAGDEAMHVFAVRDAIVHYERARQVGTGERLQESRQLDLPASAIQHLYLQLGKAYEHYNEFEQAQSVYEALLAFARALSIPAVECAALNNLAALVAYNRYDLERAATLLHQALRVAERSGMLSSSRKRNATWRICICIALSQPQRSHTRNMP